MNQFEVKRMLMIETASYDSMYLRPYETSFNQEISNVLAESTQYGTNVNPTTLSMASTAFLQPSSVPVGQANIANGFGEKRFAFMMEVVDKTHSGFSGGVRYVLTGYTNHLGVSTLSGSPVLDQNMAFYFNNMFVLRDTVIDTPHGKELMTNMSNSSHILHNPGSQDYMQQVGSQFTLRPEDVCAQLDYAVNPVMAEFHGAEVHDARATLTGVRTSDRRKEARPFYLSETIKQYQSAQADSNIYDEVTDHTPVWGGARNKLREPPMSSNRFFSSLSGMSNYRNCGFVSYAELCTLLPDLDYRAEVITSGHARQAAEYRPGQGEAWGGSTFETMAATLIQQLVPGIMSDSLFTKVSFMATNYTLNGTEDVKVLDVQGFTEGLDYSMHINHFIDRLKREILWDISKGGQMSYQVEVHINLLFDSTIIVSIDGGPQIPYTAPAFCDGLYSPVVANEVGYLERMAYDIEAMIGNLGGDLTRMAVGQESAQPQQQQGNGYQGSPISFDTSL